MVKVRLSRRGRSNRPFFVIVATDSRSARDGRFLEKLGEYDPNHKTPLMNVKMDALNNYLEMGAKISDSVKSLLKKYPVNN